MSFSIQDYPKLKTAIEENNLVLFVGAGTSINLINSNGAEIGNWNILIQNILLHLKDKGHDVNHLEKSLKTSNPLKVLDELEQFYNEIEKNSIYEFTTNYFNIDKDKNDLEFQKKLFTLSSKIISTNYDKAFEIACPTLEQNNKIILRGNSPKIERLKNENEFLLKLHGCYSQENTMVLFNCDYENLYENDSNIDSKHLLTFLFNLFYNKTILFVGYGMGDEEINLIFNNIQKVTRNYSHKHFIISKDKIIEELKFFLTHIPVDEHSEIPKIIDSLIATKQNYDEEKKKELQKQLDSLSKASKNNTHKKLINELFQEAIEFNDTKEYVKAIQKYSQISLLENISIVFYNWAVSLFVLSKIKTSTEKEELLLDSFKKYEKAIELDENYSHAFINWGISIYHLSNLKTGKEREDLLLDSCKKYEKATLNENYFEAFYNWGVSIYHLSNLKTEKEKEELLLDSCKKYEKAIGLDENHSNTFNNWGNSIFNLSNLKIGKEKEELLIDSCKKYEKAIQLDENNSKAFYNWGNSIFHLSNLKIGKEKEELLIDSCKKYEKAIIINENYSDAFYNFGITLVKLSELKADNDKEKLLIDSCEKFEKAIEIDENYSDAFNNWGTSLADLSNLKTGKEKEELLLDSCKKYEKAIELDENYSDAFYNWGSSLMKIGIETTDKIQRNEIYQEAEKVLLKGINIGSQYYNLACSYAIQNKRNEALKYLEITLKNNEVTTQYIFDDDDWTLFKNDQDFLNLLEKYKSN